MPNILDILSERFPVVGARIKQKLGSNPAIKTELPDDAATDFRATLFAIPELLVPKVELAMMKFAMTIDVAIQEFIADIGHENVMAGVMHIFGKFENKTWVN